MQLFSRESSVSVVITLRAGGKRKRGSIRCRDERFVFHLQTNKDTVVHIACGMGTGGSFLLSKVVWTQIWLHIAIQYEGSEYA
jgi:hypothetical protein